MCNPSFALTPLKNYCPYHLLSLLGGGSQASESLPLVQRWAGASGPQGWILWRRCRFGGKHFGFEGFPAVSTVFLTGHPGIQSLTLMFTLVLCLRGFILASPSVSMSDLKVHSVSSDVQGSLPFLVMLGRTELKAPLPPNPGSVCECALYSFDRHGVLECVQAPQLSLGVPCFFWGSDALFRISHLFPSKEKLQF